MVCPQITIGLLADGSGIGQKVLIAADPLPLELRNALALIN
jgi:hypothetical protein